MATVLQALSADPLRNFLLKLPQSIDFRLAMKHVFEQQPTATCSGQCQRHMLWSAVVTVAVLLWPLGPPKEAEDLFDPGAKKDKDWFDGQHVRYGPSWERHHESRKIVGCEIPSLEF